MHALGSDEHYISRNVEKHRRKYREGYPYLRIYDIDPMIRREDIESIVEARVQEWLAQRKDTQAEEIESLKKQAIKVETLEKVINLISERVRIIEHFTQFLEDHPEMMEQFIKDDIAFRTEHKITPIREPMEIPEWLKPKKKAKRKKET